MRRCQNKLTFNFSFLKEKHMNTFRDYCFKAYSKNKEMKWSPDSLIASPLYLEAVASSLALKPKSAVPYSS